jgi:hypothetical protein
LEDLAKSVVDHIDKAYPPINRHIVPIHLENGMGCVAAVIAGSPERPHFAGKPYIRDAPQTKQATSDDFRQLLAERQPKAREILKWRGRDVSWLTTYRNGSSTPGIGVLEDCNEFYLTLPDNLCVPLEHALISHDRMHDRLLLEIQSPLWQS